MTKEIAKEFDIVIYGASGFTGKHVAAEIANHYNHSNLKWALAGRDEAKLTNVLDSLNLKKTDYSPKILIANVDDLSTLSRVIGSTKVLINCVGPFRYWGEAVVKSCVENRTHYVDINGETEFVERSFLKYDDEAKKNKVSIVTTCGFDCIPSEMGNLFTRREFTKKGYIPAAVEAFFQFHSGPKGLVLNYATYESAVQSVAHVSDLRKLRRLMPSTKVETKGSFKLKVETNPHFEQRIQKWTVPFAGADVSVVKLGQKLVENNKSVYYRTSYVPPVQFSAYFATTGIVNLLGLIFFGLSMAILTKFNFGKKLLLANPGFFTFGVFSKNGPTKQHMEECTFSVTFYGKGFSSLDQDMAKPDYQIVTRVTGPEAGYVSTPIAVVASAMTILNEKERIPNGVLTPASAFLDTGLIDKLESRGINFAVISSANIAKN